MEFLNLWRGDSDPECTLGCPLPSPLWEGKKIRKQVSSTGTFSRTSSQLQAVSRERLVAYKGHLPQARRAVPYSNSITYCLLELEQIT